MCERESVCVCVREREVCVLMCAHVYVCACLSMHCAYAGANTCHILPLFIEELNRRKAVLARSRMSYMHNHAMRCSAHTCGQRVTVSVV